jgi:hypothetical protein
VILHVRYTARDGGTRLKQAAASHSRDYIGKIAPVRLFSVRHEFPSEWARFQNQTPAANQRFELKFNLRDEHYPFWSKGRLKGVKRVDILARSSTISGNLDVFEKREKTDSNGRAVASRKETLVKNPAMGNLLTDKFTNKEKGIALLAKPAGELKLCFEDRALEDLWIAIAWSDQATS